MLGAIRGEVDTAFKRQGLSLTSVVVHLEFVKAERARAARRAMTTRTIVVPAKAGAHTPCLIDDVVVMGPGPRSRSPGTTD